MKLKLQVPHFLEFSSFLATWAQCAWLSNREMAGAQKQHASHFKPDWNQIEKGAFLCHRIQGDCGEGAHNCDDNHAPTRFCDQMDLYAHQLHMCY